MIKLIHSLSIAIDSNNVFLLRPIYYMEKKKKLLEDAQLRMRIGNTTREYETHTLFLLR